MGFAKYLLLGLLLGILFALNCSGGKEVVYKTYSDKARAKYVYGLKLLKDKNFTDASKAFQDVRTQFPYSKYAVYAELGIVDCQLGEQKYIEAIEGYKMFIKLHPKNPQVEYAYYMIGVAYHKQIFSKFLAKVLMIEEKDQYIIENALKALKRYVLIFPNGRFQKEAGKIIKECADILCAHEMYVARFYAKKRKYRGTLLRLKYMLTHYPDLGYDEKALYMMGQAYAKLKEQTKAIATFQTLLAKFPKSSYKRDAESYIQKLEKEMKKGK